jgi:transposase
LSDALNQLSAAAPAWVQQHVPLDWYTRYGLRADQMRLPKEASKRAALARQVGLDGYQLLDAVWAATSAPYLRTLPAVEALRQMWVQQYGVCSGYM